MGQFLFSKFSYTVAYASYAFVMPSHRPEKKEKKVRHIGCIWRSFPWRCRCPWSVRCLLPVAALSWLVLLSKAAAAIRSTLMALCRCRAVAGAGRGRYTVARLARSRANDSAGRRLGAVQKKGIEECVVVGCGRVGDLPGAAAAAVTAKILRSRVAAAAASTLVRADLAGSGVCRSKRALGSVSQATPRPWLPFGYSRARR